MRLTQRRAVSLALTTAMLVASCGTSVSSDSASLADSDGPVPLETTANSAPPDQLANNDESSEPIAPNDEAVTTTSPPPIALATPRQIAAIADTFLLDPVCAADLLGELTEEELDEIGFYDDETAPNAMQQSISDISHPAFDPLMLTFAQCADHFDQLMAEDLGPGVPPAIVSCVIDDASTEPAIISLVVIGTTDSSVPAESYPPAFVDLWESAGERLLEIAASCAETI